MKNLLVVAFLLGLSAAVAQPTDTLEFNQALTQKRVAFQARGLGGYSGKVLRLLLRNSQPKPVVIRIEVGQFFLGEDTGYQRLVATEEVFAQVNPGQTATVDCYTMCTQASRMSPPKALSFTPSGKASGMLLSLVQLIAAKKYQNESTAQSAVWAVTDNHDAHTVYGTDTTMIGNLARLLAPYKNISVASFMSQPLREMHITEINSSIELFIEKNTPQTHLVLYDGDGQEVRRYFDDRDLEAGFLQFRIGHFHTGEPADSFELRLEAEGRVLARKLVLPSDTVLALTKVQTEGNVSIQLASPLLAQFAVVDELGRVCMYLSQKAQLAAGFHRTTLQFKQALLPGHSYTLQIRDMSGKVLGSTPVVMEYKEIKRPAEIEVKGIARYEVTAPLTEARMTLVNASGEVLAVVFEHGTLSPGAKTLNYNYTSLEGPEGIIYLRLVDGLGQEVVHKQIYPVR